MSPNKSRVKKTKPAATGEQKFTLGIALVTLMLVLGYFIQSAIEIYHQKPITIAIERLTDSEADKGSATTDDSAN
jgi:hypothetical protein